MKEVISNFMCIKLVKMMQRFDEKCENVAKPKKRENNKKLNKKTYIHEKR